MLVSLFWIAVCKTYTEELIVWFSKKTIVTNIGFLIFVSQNNYCQIFHRFNASFFYYFQNMCYLIDKQQLNNEKL